MAPPIKLSHGRLYGVDNSVGPWNQIIVIGIFVLLIISVVNAMYIAYSQGRAAGQQGCQRDAPLISGDEEYLDTDDDDQTLRWMRDEEYGAEDEDGSSLLS